MSNKCENQMAMHVDWELGNVFSAPCLNNGTKMVLDGTGFSWLCDECTEKLIKSSHLTIKIDHNLKHENDT